MADHIDDGFDDVYGNSWLELSKSDYARVLFCDLSSYDEEFGVGCRFQITDNVHEDPCDYVGLYRVGWKHISEYIVFKLLSNIECEEDGKMLRCIFKGEDLPKLTDGFYQFLYVTRDNEVCGASTPFEVKIMKEDSASDNEDIVADKTEDDFLVVRSTLFEKNRELESKLSELQEKIESLEMEKCTTLAKMEKISEESKVLQQLKESNAAAIRSFTAQVQSLEASVENHKITNERYESHIIDYQAKVTSHEKKVRKTEQELKKLEDINLHLREQLKLMEKHMEDQRSQLKGHHTDFTQQNCLLAQQLENTKSMLRAAEESKQLAVEELKIKSPHSTQNNGSKYNSLLVEKFALKLQLDDEKKLTGQMEKERKSLEEAIIELNKIVKDKELLLRKTMGDQKELQEKYDDLASHAKMEIIELQEKYEQLSTQTKEQATEQELTQMNKIMILDLEDQVAQLRERVQEKDETIDKIKDTVNDLTSNCALWEDEVNDLKSYCEDLNKTLAEKDDSTTKLKEECIKKEAVIEYLTEEKDRVLKSQASMSEQLNEMGARLRMAAELYREQYLKIKKLKSLKSKVYKMKTDSENQAHSSSSQRSSVASYRDLFTALNSDSDTGEHVQRASAEKMVKNTEMPQNMKWSNQSTSFLFTAPKLTAAQPNLGQQSPSQLFRQQELGGACSIPKDFGKTETVLQELIQQNLAKLCTRVSEPECDVKEKDDTAYTLPCPVCETDIVITKDDADPMVAHLEYGHNQQMCPVCGRMFDKTMPDNYFKFHVEDHYNGGTGDEKKMKSQ